jgi:hypothetical protein
MLFSHASPFFAAFPQDAAHYTVSAMGGSRSVCIPPVLALPAAYSGVGSRLRFRFLLLQSAEWTYKSTRHFRGYLVQNNQFYACG